MRHVLRATFGLFVAFECCGIASAADLPVKAPPPAPVYYNWTGFYLGVNLGGSWGHQCADVFINGTDQGSACVHPDGVIGGGQIGYNWQFAPWFGWGNGTVLGIEADFQGSDQRTDHNFGVLLPAVVTTSGTFTDRLEWFGTVRGRVGIAYDRFLPYFTGGWAYGNRTFDGTVSTTVPAVATASFSNSNTLSGWTVGGGFEWAFWRNWTAKFEYLYIDFGNNGSNLNGAVFTGPAGNTVSFTTGHFTDNIARAGVNYKF
jgi:outer membrane immunogenic protein